MASEPDSRGDVMGGLKAWHIAVLVVVLLLLFGAKRLPDAARGLGRSLRIFKAETKGLLDDDVRTRAEAQNTRSTVADDESARASAAEDARRAPEVVEAVVIDAPDTHQRTREQR
jgi:sec-independent protein translocase protein TatA